MLVATTGKAPSFIHNSIFKSSLKIHIYHFEEECDVYTVLLQREVATGNSRFLKLVRPRKAQHNLDLPRSDTATER